MKRVAEDTDRGAKRHKSEFCFGDSIAIFKDPSQEKDATDLLDWAMGETGYISGKVHMRWPPVAAKYKIVMETFSLATGTKHVEIHFAGRCAEEFQSKGLHFKVAQKPASISQRCTMSCAGNSTGWSEEPGCKIDTWFRPQAEIASLDLRVDSQSVQDDWFSTPKHATTPVLAVTRESLMAIDEEPLLAAPPNNLVAMQMQSVTLCEQRRPSCPTHPLNPLHNIGNSLPTASPRQPPEPRAPSSFPSTSWPVNATVPAPPNVVHIPAPTENRPNGRDPLIEDSPPPRISRPPNANGNHASTTKLVDRRPAVGADTVPLPNCTRPEIGPPSKDPSAQVRSTPTAEPETTEPLNKKQRKNKARKEKRKLKAGLPAPGTIPSAPSTIPPPNRLPSLERSAPVVSIPSADLPVLAARSSTQSIHLRRSTPPRLATTQTTAETEDAGTKQATCLQIPSDFISLSEVKAKSKGVLCSVIGVVTSNEPPSKTRKGEWSRCIYLVDPTDYGGDSLLPSSSQEGFRVNCFTKNYQEWLPTAKPSDILILRGIKLTEFNGQITANGYHDRLQWAVCSKQKLGHGNRGGAPQSEGYGVSFTPFYQATHAELAFCLELTDWWRGVTEKRTAAMGTINQIGGDFLLRVPRRTRREHKLLSGGIAPDSFFDCTVESGNLYSLYVTDFTVWQEDWCPRSLSGSVLRIEMWDAAAQQGPTMNVGEFYSLRNVLMRRWDGYAQGKLVETKIEKLELSDAEKNSDLKALLERKSAHGPLSEITESELKLIGQGRDREYLSCVICAINEPWARGLNGYVLKVLLLKEQSNMIKSLQVGRHYLVKNLRLEPSVTEREFRGRLGTSERQIHLINPNSSLLADWRESLIKRKTDLKREAEPQTEPRLDIILKPVEDVDVDELPENHHPFVSIKQVLSSTECPGSLFEDSFVRACTKCHQLISDKRLSCLACDDIERKRVKIICILSLSVAGDIPLLKGLEPAILRDDPDAARQFSQRMQPLLSNLVEVHNGLLKKELIEPSGQVMTLIVDSWKGEDDNIEYGLRDFKP
ncbi:hypothetical protein B0H11DRAFT_2024748 [Mycena galericulata]|nr:hypothetical protein B0H11DRAFT_2024748 [Mycena galericulata]